jgi:hypothetical protein
VVLDTLTVNTAVQLAFVNQVQIDQFFHDEGKGEKPWLFGFLCQSPKLVAVSNLYPYPNHCP